MYIMEDNKTRFLAHLNDKSHMYELCYLKEFHNDNFKNVFLVDIKSLASMEIWNFWN